jgi:hypothetical protein
VYARLRTSSVVFYSSIPHGSLDNSGPANGAQDPVSAYASKFVARYPPLYHDSYQLYPVMLSQIYQELQIIRYPFRINPKEISCFTAAYLSSRMKMFLLLQFLFVLSIFLMKRGPFDGSRATPGPRPRVPRPTN